MTKQQGFTLIEIIVAIAIIAIIPAIVIPNFPQARLQFALSRTAYSFAKDVRRAQAMALSAVPYTDSLGASQPISGYGIQINLASGSGLGNKKYIIYADKQPGNAEYDTADYTVGTYETESGIVIKEIQNVVGSSASINFAPPKPDTTIISLASGQTAITVVFAFENDPSRTKTVSINLSGLIEVK